MFQTLNLAAVLLLLASTVIPLLSSLLTKAHMPGELRGMLTLALATAAGFLTEWAHAGDAFDYRRAAGNALVAFITAALSRVVIWKGTATDEKALAVGSQPVGQHRAG